MTDEPSYNEKREAAWQTYAAKHGYPETDKRRRKQFNATHWLEANRWVHRHFFEVLTRIAEQTDVPIGTILNTRRRAQTGGPNERLTTARGMLVEEMRGHVGRPDRLSTYSYYPEGLPEGYLPISYPDLARFVGCDHSSLVLINQGVVARRKRQREEAQRAHDIAVATAGNLVAQEAIV